MDVVVLPFHDFGADDGKLPAQLNEEEHRRFIALSA
jgi:hypothetical protein